MRKFLMLMFFSLFGSVALAQNNTAGDIYPAQRTDIGPGGQEIWTASVPGKFEVRYYMSNNGSVQEAVVINSRTKKIVGVSVGANLTVPQKQGGMVLPNDVGGPPPGHTGVWLLSNFPGGGAMYGEYQHGIRTGTIIVQPDGTIQYYQTQQP